MTKQEALIISAYTGFLMVDFAEYHKYIEKIMERPVWTHEFASEKLEKGIQKRVKNDFMKLCEEANDRNKDYYG